MLAIHETDGARFTFGSSEPRYDAEGDETTRYIRTGDAGGTLARITDGEEIELQFSDALQNLMLTVNDEGEVTSAFQYGAFGEVVFEEGIEDHNRPFNGKEEEDAATGLRSYGARYDDPLTSLWTTARPGKSTTAVPADHAIHLRNRDHWSEYRGPLQEKGQHEASLRQSVSTRDDLLEETYIYRWAWEKYGLTMEEVDYIRSVNAANDAQVRKESENGGAN